MHVLFLFLFLVLQPVILNFVITKTVNYKGFISYYETEKSREIALMKLLFHSNLLSELFSATLSQITIRELSK